LWIRLVRRRVRLLLLLLLLLLTYLDSTGFKTSDQGRSDMRFQ